ncbi:LPD38 domain-containing protein [Bradyrhizobium zhanjiangense]|uniref:LPD38 domain-containing protein n=1 Tax=Bradyrhizobium zhanjiangense TaxID=1325107 RepID=UPI0010091D38|nr:LPD38 domain-containing protein [Bradyrhizobium zhanjiangense]
MMADDVAGLLEAGNIDLNNRPVVKNDDGTISTVNVDGKETLIPTVSDDGRIMSNDEAVAQFRQTGRHLGKFDSPENATRYAESLHTQQASRYAPEASPKVPDEEGPSSSNHFDQFDADPDAGEAGLIERARLNAVHSFYRGTLNGSTKLAGLANLFTLPEESGSTERRAWLKEQKAEYSRIVGDLARYDAIRPWDTTEEGASALAGQIAGGLLSPESFLGGIGKGASFIARALSAAAKQGLITGAINPAVQGFNIAGGVQKNYSLSDTGWAMATGAVIGGGLHIGGELVSSARIKSIHADLAEQDPQFASASTQKSTTVEEAGPAVASNQDQAAGELESAGQTFDKPPLSEVTEGATQSQGSAASGSSDVGQDRTIRFYHGGTDPTSGGPRWVTPYEDYARHFRTDGGTPNEVHYVDIPESELKTNPTLAAGYDEINDKFRHFEAPEEIARQLRPLENGIAKPRPAPKAPDPLDLAMSGELSAERARAVAADLEQQQRRVEDEIFGDRADEWRKLHRKSDRAWDNARDDEARALDAQIDKLEREVGLTEADENWLNGQGWSEHSVAENWHDLARNLQDIENGREDAIAAVASAVREIPKVQDWSQMNSRQRESVLTILTAALNEEKKAGRDPKEFLKDAFRERVKRYGSGHDAKEIVDAQMQELADFLSAPIERSGPSASPASGSAPMAVARIGSAGLPGDAVPKLANHRVAVADGSSIDVSPRVIEASDLKASSDAGFDQALQPRDRDRAASQAQIADIANRLDPDRLGLSSEADRGAPIVGPDAIVESGNGRVMAIRRAYQEGGEGAQRYREWLSQQGVDLSHFREPVLVRVRLTELSAEERQAFTVAANQSASLGLSAPERALSDARLLPTETLDLIRNADDLGALANREFTRAFVAKLPPTERAAMLDAGGGLSAEGLTRIRNAVLARAYGNAHVLTRIAESLTDDSKSISNALVSAAPHWAKMRAEIEAGLVRGDMDLTPELLEAVQRTADLRAKGTKLQSHLDQQDAFDRLSEPVEAFMRMFYDPSGRRAAAGQRISDALRFYAEEARKVTADAGLDLGLVPVTARDVQKLAAGKGAEGYVKRTDEGGLFLTSGSGYGAHGTARGRRIQRQDAAIGGRGPRESLAGSNQGAPGRAESASLTEPGGAAREAAAAPRQGSDNRQLSVAAPTELAALSSRQSGGRLPMEKARPSEGISTEGGTGTALANVAEAPAPQRQIAIRSLQQQAIDIAKQLEFPLREGRVRPRSALGVFTPGTGVVRVREVPDFEVVAHEAGHALEYKVGQDLTDLTERFGSELRPMVSNPAAYDPSVHVKEGFAEFVRRYIGNPAWAEQNAPRFTNAFRDFMQKRAPDLLATLDRAGEAYRAYLDAPSVNAIGSVVRSVDEQPHGLIAKGIAAVREDGLPVVVKSVLQKAYRAILDERAPVATAVRDLARAISEQTGKPLDLKAADNPDILMRLAGRSQQAAIGDMMEGVRPYHATTPEGPSLSVALETATGGRNSGGWGKWDPVKKEQFSTYLVSRRAEVLWRKFKDGQLLNPPAAFSVGDATRAMADLEAANPTFRQASDMVHAYTRELLRKAYEGGLIPADLFEKLGKEEFYVPFMRDLSDKPMAGSGFESSSEGPGMTQVVKRMTGSSRDIKDPIESIMLQTFLVNRTLQHNDVIRSFVRLAEEARLAGGKYVERIPAQEARQYTFDLAEAVERLAKKHGIDADDTAFITGALTDVFGDDPIIGSFFKMEPTGKRGEPIVFYKEGGELRAARFMSEAEGLPLYELVTALPAKMTDLFSEVIAASSSVVRTGIVTNPTFALSNYVRDQFATALLRSDYVPILSGLEGIRGEFTQSEAARLYGVGGGVSPGSSIAPVERAIEADVNALAKKGYLVNRVTTFKGAMELASFTEAGTRNSVFGKVFAAKKLEGLSDYEAMIEAAFQATDILDFSRHGSRTEAVRRYVPFINAHLQGLDKAYRTMVQPVLDRVRGDQVLATDAPAFRNALASWGKVFGAGAVLGAGWAALNADSEAYRDTSPRLKGTHLVIPLGGKILLLPKPFELGLGFTAGEYAYQRFAQDDPRAAGQFVQAAWDVLAPPNPLTDIPIIRTPIELATGKSLFTGRDIVPDTIARRTPAEQYTDRTSALAKYIGRTIGVSPIKVDYAVGAAFGTWGRDAMALSQGVDQDAPAANWDDAVFFRRFIKDPTRTSDVTTKFWDLMGQSNGKYNQDVASYDNLVKSFRDADAQQFLSKLPSSEKAFVTLKSAAREDGKPAFNADQKRLHPLIRAADAVTLLNGLRLDLIRNTFNTFESGRQLRIDPPTRRDLIDNVRELAQLEMRNAFVIMKEPGYVGRPMISTETTMEKIRSLSPVVADEIAVRYATAKIYTTDAVAEAYPRLQQALVRDGSDADLGTLAFDAKADGYEFGGERVKRPQKRRLQIVPKMGAR